MSFRLQTPVTSSVFSWVLNQFVHWQTPPSLLIFIVFKSFFLGGWRWWWWWSSLSSIFDKTSAPWAWLIHGHRTLYKFTFIITIIVIISLELHVSKVRVPSKRKKNIFRKYLWQRHPAIPRVIGFVIVLVLFIKKTNKQKLYVRKHTS